MTPLHQVKENYKLRITQPNEMIRNVHYCSQHSRRHIKDHERMRTTTTTTITKVVLYVVSNTLVNICVHNELVTTNPTNRNQHNVQSTIKLTNNNDMQTTEV